MSGRPDIALHIEQLIVTGFEGIDRARLAEAVERELSRLLGEGSAGALFRGGGDAGGAGTGTGSPHLDAGSFVAAAGGSPEGIGAGIARALHAGLGRGAPAGGDRGGGEGAP
jgi:hypothetical protein